MTRMLACIGIVAVSCCMVFGQSAEKPAFEIADVHPSVPSPLAQLSISGPRAGRYELRNATMLDLVMRAYGVTDDKVTGGPSWLASDRFDVIAKTPANATAETAKSMLQALLADRFSLKVHDDSKPLPVYVLTVAKNGPKMKKSDGSQNGCAPKPPAPPEPGVIPYREGSCHNITTAGIADILRQVANDYLDHPVIDSTKLEGTWDFDIKYTARPQLAAAGSDGISLFDAVEKQLGLKLELQTTPTAVIVIDNVNRKPTDNAPGVAQSLPPEKPEFETAEIKPSPPGTQGIGLRYNQGGRVDAMGSLRDLIAISNEILPNLASDFVVGPKFLETSHYTIVAKVPGTGIGAASRDGGREVAPPINVALMMLRSMLEERFKLVTHREDRPATVYALSAPKAETKLKKADASERAGCKQDPGAVPPSAGTTPMIAMTCVNTTMADIVKNLPQWAGAYIDHPVIDTTGLQGGWNFTLMWTPRGALENRPANGQPPAPGAAAASDPSGGISVFDAIEKQLGLKLEKGTHPMPVIVIDHAEEKPVD
jgi:uncharacterized protein (TIGR03435 family)